MNNKWWGQQYVVSDGFMKATPTKQINLYYDYSGESTPHALLDMSTNILFSIPTGQDFVPTSISIKTDGTALTATLGKSNSTTTMTVIHHTFLIPSTVAELTFAVPYKSMNTLYCVIDTSVAGVEKFVVTGHLVPE